MIKIWFKATLTLCAIVMVVMAGGEVKAQNSKNNYTISGKVNFLNPAPFEHLNKVWISQLNGNRNKLLDSVAIKADGTWQIKMPEGSPSFYVVDIEKWDRATIFSDSSVFIPSRGYDTAKIKIKNPPYIFVEGSDANNFINLVEHLVYRNYQNMIASGKEMYYAGQSKDSAWIKYLKESNPYEKLSKDFNERINVLIRAYEEKPEVVYALQMISWQNNKDMIVSILDNLTKKYPWFTEAESFKNEMEEKIAQIQKLQSGNPVPQINYPDKNGKSFTLDGYKGKTVLIDFWASWCGPCRAAVPKLKELYAQYKSKGFDIVSISIDDSKAAWIKAMNEEKMPWLQLLSPDKEETMKTFLFSGIPTLYLIDKEGKIVFSFSGLSEEGIEKIKKQL